jgi:CcmD family protein
MSGVDPSIYIAMVVALVVWVGIFIYLWRIDALAHELRRRLDSQPEPQPDSEPTATLTRREQPEQNKELL